MDGEKQALVAVHEQTIPSHFPSRPFQIVVPRAILPMGVRTSFFQAVPQDLEFRPMISGGGIGVQVRELGTLILVIPTTLACLAFFT